MRAFVNQPLGKIAATKIEPRHVLASGSLPPGFPWTEIEGMPHWNAGLVDNTPLGLAIDAFNTDPDVDRMLVVMNLYPLRARLPRNLAAKPPAAGSRHGAAHQRARGNDRRSCRLGPARFAR